MASRVVSKLVKPPISLFGVEGRYVNALYSAASKSNKLEVVESDLNKLVSLYQNKPSFKEYLTSPLINPSLKTIVFEGDLKNSLKLSNLTVNLLSSLAENRRLSYLPAINSTFNSVMASVRNQVSCTITSAKPMSDEKKKDLEGSLKAFSKKKLLISYQTDPSIVGGLIVDFNGEHYIDMSLRSRIKNLSELIKQAV